MNKAKGRKPASRDGRTQSAASTEPLPAMMRFDDIIVEPPADRDGLVVIGGPRWPDFEEQVLPRPCRDGVPKDRPPKKNRSGLTVDRIREPVVWGGQILPHFGHFVAEFATRLPQSQAERPDDPVYFQIPHTLSADEIPSFIYDVCDWYGLARSRIRIVDAQTRLRCREMRVAVQAEQLHRTEGCAEYLDLLEANQARAGLQPKSDGTVFVGRGGISRGHGHHGGERYLEECLKRLGVTVMYPETMPLRAQLEIFAGARHLIFAEGSAVHGRQLIGRVPRQEITILQRRPGRPLAQRMLRVRCGKVRHIDPVACVISVIQPDGKPKTPRALTLFDVPALHAAFAEMGIDLASVWDDAAYRRDLADDVGAWYLDGLDRARAYDAEAQTEAHAAMAAAAGYPELRSVLTKAARRVRLSHSIQRARVRTKQWRNRQLKRLPEGLRGLLR